MTRVKSNRQPTRSAVALPPTRTATDPPVPAWRPLGRVLGWSLTLAAVVLGMRELEARVLAVRPHVQCTLQWMELPPWLAEPSYGAVLRQIAAAAAVHPDDDVQDAALCRRVADGLLRCPWVAEVKRATKQPNGVIRVRASFREPFAYVEVAGTAYLVDKTGVRLPNKVERAVEHVWDDWLRIAGVSGPIPEEGQAWTGADAAAGLNLVQYLKQAATNGEVPFRSSLRVIDVANFGRRESGYGADLRIRTVQSHCLIEWGLPPNEEYTVESSPNRKLEMLRAFFSEHGGQFPDGWVYDVRGPDGIRRWAYSAG